MGEALSTCSNCGGRLQREDRFCGECGTPATPKAKPPKEQPLLESRGKAALSSHDPGRVLGELPSGVSVLAWLYGIYAIFLPLNLLSITVFQVHPATPHFHLDVIFVGLLSLSAVCVCIGLPRRQRWCREVGMVFIVLMMSMSVVMLARPGYLIRYYSMDPMFQPFFESSLVSSIYAWPLLNLIVWIVSFFLWLKPGVRRWLRP